MGPGMVGIQRLRQGGCFVESGPGGVSFRLGRGGSTDVQVRRPDAGCQARTEGPMGQLLAGTVTDFGPGMPVRGQRQGASDLSRLQLQARPALRAQTPSTPQERRPFPQWPPGGSVPDSPRAAPRRWASGPSSPEERPGYRACLTRPCRLERRGRDSGLLVLGKPRWGQKGRELQRSADAPTFPGPESV